MADNLPMSIAVDVAGPEDLVPFFQILCTSFPVPSTDPSPWIASTDPTTVRVARVDGRVAAGAVLVPTAQYFGGQAVPMVGLNAVAVAQEHRGRGVGSLLMREIVRELAAEGVALSCLYPATQPIYRSVGYEQAGTRIVYRLPISSFEARDRAATLEPVGFDDRALLDDIHERWARLRPGNVRRTDWLWRRLLAPSGRKMLAYRVVEGGETTGFAVLHQRCDAADSHGGTLFVPALVAATDAARIRLWSLLADHRSMCHVVEIAADPGFAELAPLREQSCEVAWLMRWMLRLIDIPAALAARGYNPALRARLELAVDDPLIPGNADRFVVGIADGRAIVEQGGAGALRCDARTLARLYSGHADPWQLAADGRLAGDDAALAAAAAAFAGPAPSMVDFF